MEQPQAVNLRIFLPSRLWRSFIWSNADELLMMLSRGSLLNLSKKIQRLPSFHSIPKSPQFSEGFLVIFSPLSPIPPFPPPPSLSPPPYCPLTPPPLPHPSTPPS